MEYNVLHSIEMCRDLSFSLHAPKIPKTAGQAAILIYFEAQIHEHLFSTGHCLTLRSIGSVHMCTQVRMCACVHRLCAALYQQRFMCACAVQTRVCVAPPYHPICQAVQ